MRTENIMTKAEQILSKIKDGFRTLVQPIVDVIADVKPNPNILTAFSLLLSVAAAVVFAVGRLQPAALLLLLAGFLDILDGGVARASNRTTRFGALLDSVLDRYSEFAVFAGLGYHFFNREISHAESGRILLLLIAAAMGGSLIVSYVRARAEGLGFDCRVGLFQRPERLVVLSLGALISEQLLIIAVGLIAVMANVSALQRIYHVWKLERTDGYESVSRDVHRTHWS